MTEYDYSPEGYRQFQRTQQRIANWADDTAQCAHKYRNPFAPRSDADFAGNDFYSGGRRSGSSSRQHTPSPSGSSHGHHPHHSSRRQPQRSQSHGTVAPPPGMVRSPLRSNTIAVSPEDSISQVSSRRRARSHSPTHRSRSHRSGGGTTYVVSPQPQYNNGSGGYFVQSPPAPVQYGYGYPQQAQPQPAAYVVYPRDRKVQIVYPEPHPHTTYPPAAHPAQEHHSSLLSRIFGSHSGKSSHSSRRSRSVSVPRSGTRR